MKKVTKRVLQGDGSIIRQPKDMRELLNLNYLRLTQKTLPVGDLDLPALCCSTDIIPDFLALYNQPGTYHKTALTAVCFYIFDRQFDGINGLFNAIYYNDKDLLRCYKARFKDVRFVLSPDYSQFGDMHNWDSLFRLAKARVVALWFIIELGAVVIPSTTYVAEDSFPQYFAGLENCQVVAFSTKGHVRRAAERRLLKAAVKYAVDHLPLKTIVVYSVCGKDNSSLKLFQYAIERGINVVIPQNTLRERNQRRCAG